MGDRPNLWQYIHKAAIHAQRKLAIKCGFSLSCTTKFALQWRILILLLHHCAILCWEVSKIEVIRQLHFGLCKEEKDEILEKKRHTRHRVKKRALGMSLTFCPQVKTTPMCLSIKDDYNMATAKA